MLAPFANAVHQVFLPLVEATTDPAKLRVLLERCGVAVPDVDAAMAADFADALGLQGEFVVLTAYEETSNLAEILGLIEAASTCYTRLKDLVSGDASIDVSALPAPLDDPAAAPALFQQILDTLVSAYVADSLPPLNSLLLLSGIRTRYEPGPIYWAKVPEMFDDPGGVLADAYGWGKTLDLGQIDAAIAGVSDLLPLPLERRVPRDALTTSYWPEGAPPDVYEYVLSVARLNQTIDGVPVSGEFGLVLMAVPQQTAATPSGLLLAPMAAAALTHTITLGGGWTLDLTAGADLTGVVGLALVPTPAPNPNDPDSRAGLMVEPTTGAGDFEVDFLLRGSPKPDQPWGFGGNGGPRLDLHGVAFGLGIEGSATDAVPKLTIAVEAPGGGPGLTVSLADPEADGFMGWILGDEAGVELSFQIEITPEGFRVVGGLGMELSIPIDRQFGPLYLARADVGLGVQLGEQLGLRAQATVTGNVEIGPLVLVADGLGVALVVEAAPDGEGLFGATDLRFALVPPTAFGASFKSEIVTGGGYVEITPPRYSGILDLQVLAVGITVVGVVDAAVAGAPPETPRFSLYLSVLTEFTPIPLAFGFTLNGVGGIVAFNRTMDTAALVDGLFAGDLDHILYPEDPVADAPQILASIDAFFPVQQGATTFGPVVRIGWGVPVTLVTIDLGVIISFPDLAIVLIGKVHVALPDEDVPLLELNAQVLGIVDFSGPTIMILASIQDSQILGIQLSGDFAVYLDLGSRPYFLFSVGGTHPDWVAPAGLPPALLELENLGATIVLSDSVFIRVGGYFALTSNTVQFGGGLYFEASTKFLFTTYYAVGTFEVHVLIIFNPFRIKARLRAGLEVRTDKKVLLGVLFTAGFEGPRPWYANGGAEFKFFGVNVNFPVEIGSRAQAVIAPPADVAGELAAALDHEDAWRLRAATEDASATDAITWKTYASDVTAPLRPQDAVEVSQSVVPLNQTIEKYGEAVPSGADHFEIGSTTLGGRAVEVEIVTEVFAPSIFFEMTRAERLTAASFETFDAGVSFGGGASTGSGHEATVSIAHEQKVVGTTGRGGRAQSVQLPPERLTTVTRDLTARIATIGPSLELIRR